MSLSWLLLSLTFLTLSFAAFAQSGPVAATVNGEPITRASLTDRLMAEFGKGLLEDLIDELIVLQEARRRQIEVTDAEVDRRVEEQRIGLPPGVKFETWLAERKFTLTAYRERMRTIVRLEKLVGPDIKITDPEIGQIIISSRHLFDEPDRVQLRGIKRFQRDHAENVRRLAAMGERFDRLAEAYSLDEGTRNIGGDLGWKPLPAIERIGVKPEKGAISQVIATEDGYWVYQVVDVQKSRSKTFAEIKQLAHKYLFDQALARKINLYFRELKDKAKVERLLLPAKP